MNKAIVAIAWILIAASAEAAPDYSAQIVDIGEGKIITVPYECELMPTPADIAASLVAELSAKKKELGLTQEFRLFPKVQTVDPKSLKIAYDLVVPYVLYDASDGPRSKIMNLHEKMWTGPAAEFAGESKELAWEVDVGCGQDLVDALHSVIKDQARILAKRFQNNPKH